MIPAAFEYHRAASVDEAVALLGAHPEAKLLAGGHSLIPAMKLRLAQPPALIDVGRIAELSAIEPDGDVLSIGAMATHTAIETSALLAEKCPILPEVAAQIGDVQVRNRGTLGGSIVHADPAADWPAAILALDADMVIAGPKGRRTVTAKKFFVDIMQTAVGADEMLVAIRVPVTSRLVAYAKFAQKASGFAIAGVAAVLDVTAKTARIGITGVAATAYRAKGVESSLRSAKEWSAEALDRAAAKAANGVEALGDIHASAEYRAQLAVVHTRRALALALSRV
jgi:aerobic carbon-monoxide dehydrogenase medium subunit